MSKLFKPSEWDTTEKAMAVVGAGVVVGACVYAYVKAKNASVVEFEKQMKDTKEQVPESTNEIATEQLEELLTGTLMDMQETRSLDRNTEEEVLRTVEPVVKAGTVAPQARVLIAQYCHMLFSLRMSADQTSSLKPWEIKELREKLAMTYLNMAWNVLNADLSSLETSERSMTCALKLDIACRLHDPDKMQEAYDEAVRTNGKNLSTESRLVLLASACLLGDTKEIKRLGGGLQLAELDALHNAAIRDNSIIDYAALYGLSEQDADAGEDGPVQSLNISHLWSAYEVISVNFLCPEGTSAPLRPDLKPGTWSRVEPPKALHLIRTGAAVSYVNPGVLPIPLSGFAGDKGLVLAGYFDLDQGDDVLRVSSFVTLQKDPQRPSMYVGKELETVYCISGQNAGMKQEEVSLDIEMEMEVDDNVLYKIT
mmetsp:Transcript_9104/g.27394  ORF Transcript_9104/g.27394 Transcript_9104/m.27394 type:complete len:425 (-) Transcript_9104:142-1416(-)|eukprot:CAMPEP_0198723134 /NCGR_PEP_ID=MMETSP1475-20131203/680_1 /TAXON_ID= ORGANISM="Unidentified sp., Strain CCMP1999" /NCGR_SAMPLE_ID=MMETSP1475 /ASSEMBLY_ACC=CAM_ASM_001111 /LENGTH=424 /DNA_ID=CAMNT_0044484149 /DNA_START=94 /DNA_END=1368 /DNA_ORIENTATION=+